MKLCTMSSMVNVDSSERKVNELVALQAIYGDGLSDLTPCYQEAALLTATGQQQDLQAFHESHGRSSCSGTLTCTGSQNSAQATLVFTLPPGYPSAAAACHVTSANLPREAADHLTQLLQQQAAAAEGSECLHVLADTLAQEMNKWCQEQHQHQQYSSAASIHPDNDDAWQQLHNHGTAGTQLRRVLLRLDHMRARASYSKTIKQWAAQLNLTGWLLFWQSLILVLLEGDHEDVSQYLYLARTVCVDVDASGRKCRERMMDILEDSVGSGSSGLSECSATAAKCVGSSTQKHHQPEAVHASGTTEHTQTRLQHAYTNFRVLEVDNLPEVVEILSATHPQYTAAGLLQLLGLRTAMPL